MSSALIPFDISHDPTLLRLAEKVQETKEPRALKKDNKTVAILMPVATALPKQGEDIWKHYDAKRVQKTLKESAGALQDVDTKTLLGDIAAQRTQHTQGRLL